MASNAIPCTAPNKKKEKACPFLDHLPLEVREVIYGFVLQVKTEQNMKSQEYNDRRREILSGSDHFWRFHLDLLLVNRQIHHEASKFFERENSFVALKVPYTQLGSRFEEYGLPVIAKGDRVQKYPNIVMELSFKDNPGLYPYLRGEEGPLEFLFASQDIPAFCISILKERDNHVQGGVCNSLHLAINPRISDNLVESRDGSPHPQSRLRRLLEPFRRLHGMDMDDVHIDGPGSESYKADIIQSMCGPSESPTEIMRKVAQAIAQGDQACNAGDLPLAVVKYKAGIDCSTTSDFAPYEQSEKALFKFDSDAGKRYYRERTNSRIRLRTRLAECYLKMKKSRMARIYAERVYGPMCSYSDRYWAQKTPLLVEEPYQKHLYANVMVIAAQISYIHGQAKDAREELEEAVRLQAFRSKHEPIWAQVEKKCGFSWREQAIEEPASRGWW